MATPVRDVEALNLQLSPLQTRQQRLRTAGTTTSKSPTSAVRRISQIEGSITTEQLFALLDNARTERQHAAEIAVVERREFAEMQELANSRHAASELVAAEERERLFSFITSHLQSEQPLPVPLKNPSLDGQSHTTPPTDGSEKRQSGSPSVNVESMRNLRQTITRASALTVGKQFLPKQPKNG